MSEAVNNVQEQQEQRLLTKKDLKKSYWMFEIMAQACCSYERLQAPGFFSGMRNIIDKLYKDRPEEKIEACKRHMEFYNSEFALVGPVILGLAVSMEEEKAMGKDVDGQAISAVKTSLMGPLAGIGDTLRQGTLIPIIGSIAISMSIDSGSLLGPIFYMVMTLAINWGISYNLFFRSYKAGKTFVSDFFASGKMERIMTIITAMGAITIGALAATTVKVSTPAVLTFGENQLAIQDLFDKVVHNLLPFAATMIVFHCLNKKVSVNKIILGIFIIGIVFGVLGIL